MTKFFFVFLVLVFILESKAENDQGCPARSKKLAALVGRTCRKKVCNPTINNCRSGKECKCARECGYSCIIPTRNCSVPISIPNMKGINITRMIGGKRVNVIPPYKFDDLAIYKCKPGYTLKNPNLEHYCDGKKGWTNSGKSICLLSCQPRDLEAASAEGIPCMSECYADDDCNGTTRCLCDGYCGRSCVDPDIDCGNVSTSNRIKVIYSGKGFFRVAHYDCEDAYYLSSGSPSRKCTGSGLWDGKQITCEPVTCTNPASAFERNEKMPGGKLRNKIYGPVPVGHWFTFRCRSPYKLYGSSNRTCMSNGRWSGINTVCDKEDPSETSQRCRHPGIPIGGSLQTRNPSFTIGSFVTFECDNNLVMIGEKKQECLFFGQWSGDGAPLCIDPRYRDNTNSILQKLRKSTENIRSTLNVGRFISAGYKEGHEIYFLFDLSGSVTEQYLNKSLTFAIKLVKRLSANATGQIRYGIIVFASDVQVLIDTRDIRPKTDDVIKELRKIALNRNKLSNEIKGGTDTARAIRTLADQLELSYALADRKKVERHVFIITDGKSNIGESPVKGVKAISSRANPPTFYSITSCVECANRNENYDAYEELLGLSNGKPDNFIVINNFYAISELLDQITDADIDYSKCGQAGDVGSVKMQAQVGRVVSGTKASNRAWPWQVVISHYASQVRKAYSNTNFLGGGSVINNKWILTAAHLFKDIAQVHNWEKDILITYGMHERPLSLSDLLSVKVKAFRGSQIITHKKYGPGTYDYDIALVKIGDEYIQDERTHNFKKKGNGGWVNYTSYIRPVCLPCMNDSCVGKYLQKQGLLKKKETFEDKCKIAENSLLERGVVNKFILAVATGFGHEHELKFGEEHKAQPSQYLQQGLLRLRDNATCERFTSETIPWPKDRKGNKIGIPFTKRMLCASSGIINQTVDTCQGDSGGPLVRQVAFKNDKEERENCWVQVGIVSWGWGCGQKISKGGTSEKVPGYYTNVFEFMPWIKNHTSY